MMGGFGGYGMMTGLGIFSNLIGLILMGVVIYIAVRLALKHENNG